MKILLLISLLVVSGFSFRLFQIHTIPASETAVSYVEVLKSERKLNLMSSDQKVIRSYRISLGGNPEGHKQCEGDQKTPEGEYTIDYVNEKSSYYRSLHITYPNAQDRARSKELGCSPGGLIFIHGQKNGAGWLGFATRVVDWTLGCIAVQNPEMDEIISMLILPTRIIIKA